MPVSLMLVGYPCGVNSEANKILGMSLIDMKSKVLSGKFRDLCDESQVHLHWAV